MTQSQQVLSFENWSHPTIKLAKKEGENIVPIVGGDKAELLGQGAMGDVFLALDFTNNPQGAPIAIKIDNFKHENASRRNYGIKEEATPSEIDTSKSILRKTYDTEGNIPILISEYRPLFLDNLLDTRSKTLTLEQRLEIIYQIAIGMGEFHSKGYVCPDVKSDNIAVQDEKRLQVQLADYGGYKITDGKTILTDSPRDNFGSVTYMPPENRSEIVGNNEEIVTGSFQSDVWIFGVNMYQILTGKKGFFEEDEERIKTEVKLNNSNLSKEQLSLLLKSKLIKHRQNLQEMSAITKKYLNLEDQLIHESINSNVKDRKLRTILHKCLDYNPANRYDTIKNVFSLLDKRYASKKLHTNLWIIGFGIASLILSSSSLYSKHNSDIEINDLETKKYQTNEQIGSCTNEQQLILNYVMDIQIQRRKYSDSSPLVSEYHNYLILLGVKSLLEVNKKYQLENSKFFDRTLDFETRIHKNYTNSLGEYTGSSIDFGTTSEDELDCKISEINMVLNEMRSNFKYVQDRMETRFPITIPTSIDYNEYNYSIDEFNKFSPRKKFAQYSISILDPNWIPLIKERGLRFSSFSSTYRDNSSK